MQLFLAAISVGGLHRLDEFIFFRDRKGLSVQSERPAQVDEIAWWTKL